MYNLQNFVLFFKRDEKQLKEDISQPQMLWTFTLSSSVSGLSTQPTLCFFGNLRKGALTNR